MRGAQVGGQEGGLPFLEREGRCFGLPRDDEEAVNELERMTACGRAFVAFIWTIFWWPEHYRGLAVWLAKRGHLVADTKLVKVFKMGDVPMA